MNIKVREIIDFYNRPYRNNNINILHSEMAFRGNNGFITPPEHIDGEVEINLEDADVIFRDNFKQKFFEFGVDKCVVWTYAKDDTKVVLNDMSIEWFEFLVEKFGDKVYPYVKQSIDKIVEDYDAMYFDNVFECNKKITEWTALKNRYARNREEFMGRVRNLNATIYKDDISEKTE